MPKTTPDLNKIRYATDPGKITEPEEGKKDEGYVPGEEPASLLWNWSRNKSHERFKLLQGNESHIIVGNATQKLQKTADYDISELVDALTDTGDKIMFLDGIHVMTGSKNLSDNDLEFGNQSANSKIDINSATLTISGDRLRGQLNIVNGLPGDMVISGNDIEGLSLRVDDPLIVDFSGTGVIKVNGKIIFRQLTLLEISNQPDKVILTQSEQSLYSNDDRLVRYDQATQTFKRRDGTAAPISDAQWIVIKSLEELTADDLLFTNDRLKIETHRSFKLDLGEQIGGSFIPYAVMIQGSNCEVSLSMTQSIRELGQLIPEAIGPNGLTGRENRRVIKNQGQSNRIYYNQQRIFSGGHPRARLDFVRPDHPYLLEWDGEIYEGLLRYPAFDNRKKCFFTDLYYWLDRRFNPQLPIPDTTLAFHTITMPPASAAFMRPVGIDDTDRHDRTDPAIFSDSILFSQLSQAFDTISLTDGDPAINAANIRKVKNGQRVQDAGFSFPGGSAGTTVVRPGSIVLTPGAESFRVMNAQDKSPVTSVISTDLTLNFSGMTAGSFQNNATQAVFGQFLARNSAGAGLIREAIFPGIPGPFNTEEFGSENSVTSNPSQQSTIIVTFDNSLVVDTADEDRPISSLAIPYYEL